MLYMLPYILYVCYIYIHIYTYPCAYRNVDPRIYSCISCIILFWRSTTSTNVYISMSVCSFISGQQKKCASALIFAETRIPQVGRF